MQFSDQDDRRDLSDYVVHFTKPPDLGRAAHTPAPPAQEGRLTLSEMVERIRAMEERDRTGYPQMQSILYDRCLRRGAKPLGAARKLGALGDSQRVVCFSETPLDMLSKLVERRSRFGMGFRKDIMVGKGGTPLWYVDCESPQAAAIDAMMSSAIEGGIDPDDPLWKLTPFIDHPGVYNGRPYRFEWEREWRVAGDVHFEPDEIAFLFIPEELHDQARQFFADVRIENSGPVYECAFIDAGWTTEQIQDALTNVPPLPDPSPSAVPWWYDPHDHHDMLG